MTKKKIKRKVLDLTGNESIGELLEMAIDLASQAAAVASYALEIVTDRGLEGEVPRCVYCSADGICRNGSRNTTAANSECQEVSYGAVCGDRVPKGAEKDDG